MIKTKIVATLGPSTEDGQAIERLMNCGVDVFRLNFSHGELEWHGQVLDRINAARGRHRHTAGVVGDLSGPKIRTGVIVGESRLEVGEAVTVRSGDEPGTAREFGSNYAQLVADVNVGETVLINDGEVALVVREKRPDRLICEVTRAGAVSSRKGINLPETVVSSPSITARDWQCVEWAIEHRLDYLALSFVRGPEELEQLREHLSRAGSEIKVIAKIEKPQAIERLEAILLASDAVMVARGDLGVEMDLARVPLIQKRITGLARRLGKPVIVATQMLQSMIEQATPTRAEVNDVANAIMDFTDAVMLSGETAVGKWPVEAVKTIRRVAQVTEEYLDGHDEPRPRMETEARMVATAAIARSVAQIVDDTRARMVAVWSQSGATARFLSKARIDVPILALTSDPAVSQQMALHYGVIPRTEPLPESVEAFTHRVNELLIANHWAQAGDRIVVVAGRPLGERGTTNTIMLHTLT